MKQSTLNKVQILYGAGDITFGEAAAFVASAITLKQLLEENEGMAHEFKVNYGRVAFDALMEEQMGYELSIPPWATWLLVLPWVALVAYGIVRVLNSRR